MASLAGEKVLSNSKQPLNRLQGGNVSTEEKRPFVEKEGLPIGQGELAVEREGVRRFKNKLIPFPPPWSVDEGYGELTRKTGFGNTSCTGQKAGTAWGSVKRRRAPTLTSAEENAVFELRDGDAM
ncbi:hypothetical protein SKAU_G00341420 [Synaphobranchus kaupii]|uniref:Uncharacterized protein n=1 Tax=Synaphobranchus kaupii TaxID=118154 RepID=A0A9Q1IJG3_SYNKA|nr:hypothetical protein SKAU_G00341420 [Synaphobranchus kaupii]